MGNWLAEAQLSGRLIPLVKPFAFSLQSKGFPLHILHEIFQISLRAGEYSYVSKAYGFQAFLFHECIGFDHFRC